MLAVGGATRVYLAAGVTDLRKGFDGLYGLVRSKLESDPDTGHFKHSSPGSRSVPASESMVSTGTGTVAGD